MRYVSLCDLNDSSSIITLVCFSISMLFYILTGSESDQNITQDEIAPRVSVLVDII